MKIIKYSIVVGFVIGLLTLNGCATLVLNERFQEKYKDSERGIDATNVKTESGSIEFTPFFYSTWISKLNEERILLKGRGGKVDLYMDINLQGYQDGDQYGGKEIYLSDNLSSLKINDEYIHQSNLPPVRVIFSINNEKINLIDIKSGGCVYIQLYRDKSYGKKNIREGRAIFIYNKVLISRKVIINMSPDAYGYLALSAISSLCIITIPLDIVLLPLQPIFLYVYGMKSYSH